MSDLLLPRNCATCAHYDGAGWCALPLPKKLIAGLIFEPRRVVCEEQTPRDLPHETQGVPV